MFFVFSIGPTYLLYPNQPNSSFTDNQVVSSTLKIWYQFRRRFTFISASTSAPLLKNHLFKPALTDSTFSVWPGKGLIFFKDLYRDGIFRSFTDLSCVYQLPPSHLFRYFQIRHCVKSLFPTFPSSPTVQLWEEFLCSSPFQKSLISKMYNKLLSYDNLPSTKFKTAWEQELGLNLEDSYWELALDKIHKSSSCARLTLIQFKVIFRVHFPKLDCHKLIPVSLIAATDVILHPVI